MSKWEWSNGSDRYPFDMDLSKGGELHAWVRPRGHKWEIFFDSGRYGREIAYAENLCPTQAEAMRYAEGVWRME